MQTQAARGLAESGLMAVLKEVRGEVGCGVWCGVVWCAGRHVVVGFQFSSMVRFDK